MAEAIQAPGRGGGPPPIGVVYNTSMSRPDAALALAALHVFESKRASRLGAVCVAGAGLDTAIFCDIVARVYVPNVRNGNQALAVGLPAVTPMPPDPLIKPAVDRKKENGDPFYVRSIRRLSDTSQAEAVLRNGVIFNAESAVVLSAPATWLARSLELAGTKDQYKQRVKRLVIVDSGGAQEDPAALRKVIAEWPTPVFVCGRDVGEALLFPGATLDKVFDWTPAHPAADAYRAFKPMPYDAPLHDLAAVHFTVQPESGFFVVSAPGMLSVSGTGQVTFTEGGGTVRRLTVDPAKRDEALTALVTLASTRVVSPPARGRGPGE